MFQRNSSVLYFLQANVRSCNVVDSRFWPNGESAWWMTARSRIRFCASSAKGTLCAAPSILHAPYRKSMDWRSCMSFIVIFHDILILLRVIKAVQNESTPSLSQRWGAKGKWPIFLWISFLSLSDAMQNVENAYLSASEWRARIFFLFAPSVARRIHAEAWDQKGRGNFPSMFSVFGLVALSGWASIRFKIPSTSRTRDCHH